MGSLYEYDTGSVQRFFGGSLTAATYAPNMSSTYPSPGAAVNINAANTDILTISGLPAKYILRRAIFHTPSAAVTTATVDVRTTAAGSNS